MGKAINEKCIHEWKLLIFSAAMPDPMGVKCTKCEAFVDIGNIPKYLNILENLVSKLEQLSIKYEQLSTVQETMISLRGVSVKSDG